LIAVIFFLLSGSYSVVTPLFESPDEVWHYPFVWHLARSWELPVQDPANPQLWQQEGGQAPLYYALAALLTSPINTDDLPALIYPNPQADIGLVRADGNVNVVVHTGREAWPWQGAVLAVHLARLMSVLLGAGTLLAIYGLGRTLWLEQPNLALLAMVFVAFNPMFLFISGSVNNDNLIIFLANFTLWWLVMMVVNQQQSSTPSGWWKFVGLGILVGLAALAKASGLILLGLVGLTLLWWGWRCRSWRIALAGNGIVALLAAAIAGWWYWRNLNLYGDLTGTQTIVAMMGSRPFSPTPGQLLAELPGLIRSFWGLFGYFSVPMPAPLYWFYNLLAATGLIGLMTILLPGQRQALPLRLRLTWPILVGWLLLTIIALIQWTLRTPASQGRFLFPALGSLAILWGIGWMALIPARWQIVPVTPLMAIIALWIPWGVIAPAYARPDPVTKLPSSMHPLSVTFDDKITLTGYESNLSGVSPGQSLPLKLCWRGENRIDRDYMLFVHLLDVNEVVVAQRNLFHGSGLYPTSQWVEGEQFCDSYVLTVSQTTFAPDQAQFEVGLYDYTTGHRLPASTGGDSLRFGNIRIRARPGQYPNPPALQFEDDIGLVGYTVEPRLAAPGDEITLTLYWQSDGAPSRDYKVFVHVVGHNEMRIAQHDSEPQGGAAPTGSWTAKQVVVDEHPLTIAPDAPAGAYRLFIGLYDGTTGERLRLLQDRNGATQANSVRLSGIRIVR
jgi:hypothetical protein